MRVEDQRTVSSKVDLCNVRIDVDLDAAPIFTNIQPSVFVNDDSRPLGFLATVTATDSDLVVSVYGYTTFQVLSA